jgi:hypothetical protein
MNTIDTRELIKTRDELKQQILDSFLETFEHYAEDTDSFEDIRLDEEELESWREDWEDELTEIEEIDEIESKVTDFKYGEQLIDESDFTEYCEELVEELGYLQSPIPPFIKDNINWEGVAADLSADYIEVDYQGVIYLVRS